MNSSSQMLPHTMLSPATSHRGSPRGRRMMLSLLLCLALLFATASTPVFSNGDVEDTEDWREYITVGKKAVEPAPTEGPREADVTLTVNGTAPAPILDVVLVIDRSWSMTYSDDGTTRIGALKEAAIDFTDMLLAAGSNNQIALVTYHTTATTLLGFSADAATVKGEINGIEPSNTNKGNGYTNMHAGMLKATDVFSSPTARSYASKIIIFMSDGVPNRYMDGTSVVGSGSSFDDDAAEAFQSAATTAKDPSGLDITVFTVGLFQGMGDTEKGLAVANLSTAASTDGYFEADTPDSLDDIYDLIGEAITTMVGKDVVIHDYVPERFTLDESSLTPSVGTVKYTESTREILWTVGIFSEGTITLEYTLEANAPWYGALFTNREVDEDGKQGAYMVIDLAAGLGDDTIIQFPDPGVRIRPYADADEYVMQMNETLRVPEPGAPYNGLLLDDRELTINEFRNELPFVWSFPEEPRLHVLNPDTITAPDGCTLVVDTDGSGAFTFTPPADTFGTFTFTYRNFVSSEDIPKKTSLNFAPMLAAVNGVSINGANDEVVAQYILASDPATVTIEVKKPEEPDTTRVFVQKYVVDTTTVSGAGFEFIVSPAYVEDSEGDPPSLTLAPTDENGQTHVDLPDGMFILVEKNLEDYTNNLPDGGLLFSVENGKVYVDDARLDDNTINVFNYPEEDPGPTPPVTPTQVPTSPPTPTDPPTPSTNVALIVEVVGPGTALPYSGAYGLDAVVQLTATPDEGAVFTGWTGPDGGAVDSNNRIVLSTSRHVIANFEIPAPPPTPTPEPTPEPEVVIPEPVIPEAPPDVEEIMTEETLPQDAPVLPKTAGLPLAALLALGATAIASGIWRKRK